MLDNFFKQFWGSPATKKQAKMMVVAFISAMVFEIGVAFPVYYFFSTGVGAALMIAVFAVFVFVLVSFAVMLFKLRKNL